MDAKRAFRWSGYYFLVSTVCFLVAAALVAAAAGLGGLEAYHAYRATGAVVPALRSSAVWLLLAVVGVAVWRFGKAWALYATLTGAVEEELADTYDNERVKSDILSVLDERLSDMQQDVQSVNRNVRRLRSAEDGDDFEM